MARLEEFHVHHARHTDRLRVIAKGGWPKEREEANPSAPVVVEDDGEGGGGKKRGAAGGGAEHAAGLHR